MPGKGVSEVGGRIVRGRALDLGFEGPGAMVIGGAVIGQILAHLLGFILKAATTCDVARIGRNTMRQSSKKRQCDILD